ncbi:putative DNA-binding protein [Actinokineospora cianjurensis]|uniref:Putative DNA-binding protein n=2 Tax=Actinokineospora cianjurensis TaxID=585224 RepID=A0A421AYG4_9PSEU|nr:putative DNA-binding protein [Actinokineospora cianjurensis]
MFEQLVSVRGEGDEWDFKETLNDLTSTSARVNLAKDALAFCNLPNGGTIIVGVTDKFEHVGLTATEKIDTTAIRRAIEKYVDGDFVVVAAEHILIEPGTDEERRYGMVYFRRRFSQPVLAALDGQIRSDKPVVFRSGDILIRRGAASIRANSGDVRRLFTNSIVHEERVRAVNEVWSCLVEQRRLVGGVEVLYDLLIDSEYSGVFARPDLAASLGGLTEGRHAEEIGRLQLRVSMVRPHIPQNLYQQYRNCATLVGRMHMKALRQRDAGIFVSWTCMDDGSPDLYLRQVAQTLVPQSELDGYWNGKTAGSGTYRPVRPLIDAAERGVLSAIQVVLSGLG